MLEAVFKNTEVIWDEAQVGEWVDCKFCDDDTGERFFVELQKEADETVEHFIAKCCAHAHQYFEHITFRGLLDCDTAEILGYDTY